MRCGRRRAGHRATALALLLLTLAGCTTSGASDVPILRSFGWFNYLDAKDLQDGCVPGASERYRLIYNAVWGEQVRVYEVEADGKGDSGGVLNVRVMFPEDLSEIDLRDPLRLYRGNTGAVPLSPSEITAFRDALRASDFEAPAPRGLTLPSDGFYWVVAACRKGVFHFNAYAYPSPRFAEIRFDRWLFQHDPTGTAVNPPGPSAPRPPSGGQEAIERRGPYSVFDLKVGENGLVGVPALF